MRQGGDGYEASDVHPGSVVRFGIWLTLGVLGSLLLMRGLLAGFDMRSDRHHAAQQAERRIRATADELRPPEPVLQGAPGSRFPLADPALEMDALRREQRAQLDAGSIPIDEAKRRLLERGLPVRSAPAPGAGR